MDLNHRVDSDGQRLDLYLSGHFPEFSRALIKKEITDGKITVNGKNLKPHDRLQQGDLIAGILELPKPVDLAPDPGILWNTVFESPEYSVIIKPAGLVVHPSAGTRTGTLVNGLLAKYPEIARVGDDPIRPGIVHRLDKEVSGLMIIARTQAAYDYFKDKLKKHELTKKYTALVYGSDLPGVGEIDFPLARSKEGKMVSVSASSGAESEAKWAVTKYEVVKRFPNHTLVRVQTITGRTHQIRAHFHGLGHPLVGDNLYFIKRFQKVKGWNQLFLCADYLSFIDPQGQKKEYTLALPEPLQHILGELKHG